MAAFVLPVAVAKSNIQAKEPDDRDPETVYIHGSKVEHESHLLAFPIKNQNPQIFSANFSVCISTFHSNFSNALQFIQNIEMYRMLGVQKVFICKSSCSQIIEKLLQQHYIKEGIIQVIDWPIASYFKLSRGWQFSKHPGENRYYGQITTLNDCVYRNMYRSKYLLLNDIDEIILPIKHRNWHQLMEFLEKNYPDAGIFLIENHIWPNTQSDENNTFNTAKWINVPGVNILTHIYWESTRPNVYNPTKMIVNPRMVIQTSVHTVLKFYGKRQKVSSDNARLPLQKTSSRKASKAVPG
ncbi:uncharacterized protein LOC102365350 [Latimeria chalumnae]|uniref:uncharacterized protein LOC102365350 n=1 Tax=Latimeria chalumnae TaxID=7897 RepID=UPI00313C8858